MFGSGVIEERRNQSISQEKKIIEINSPTKKTKKKKAIDNFKGRKAEKIK